MTPELAAVLAACGRAAFEASLVGVVVAVAALVLRRPLRALPPALQAWLWWLVAARLLMQLAGVPAIELAWLPAASSARSAPALAAAPVVPVASVPPRRGLLHSVGLASEPPAFPSASRVASAPRIRPEEAWTAAGAIWLSGVAAALALAARGLWRRRRLLRAAAPVGEIALLVALGRAQRLAGVSAAVGLRTSPHVATPLVTGILRPTIVLPAGAALSADELRLALVHELVHVRRCDALRALVPMLVRRLLFFHPLARLAEREFVVATEAACDAEVLRLAGAGAGRYGALLLRFALAPRQAARLAATWPLAGRVIHRRLDMLIPTPRSPRRGALAVALAVLAALAVALPVRLVAHDPPTPTPPTPPTWSAAPAPPAPAEAPALPSPPAGARWRGAAPRAAAPPSAPLVAPAAPVAAAPPVPLVAPMTPYPAMAPMAPMAPLPALAPMRAPELRGVDWLVLADRDAHLAVDAPRWATSRADEMATSESRPIVLLDRDGRTFVVRDAAAIDGVRRLFFEQADAARRQAGLAREQAHAAREQSRLALAESRRALDDVHRDERFVAGRLAQMARDESARVAELERQLSRLADDGLGEAAERAGAAARELAELERELARVHAALERAWERATQERSLARTREREELAERLSGLDAERRERGLGMEERREELERELERLLEEIFERELASPLEQ
ncbi:MAG TPA: M56 family metallopeptidase [Thermoanaerobaculia bacterium]